MTDKELRELDAWIAEHVFGWSRWNFNNGYTAHNYLDQTNGQANKYRKHGFVDGLTLLESFPKYTTDPAAAMEVLKKCCEHPYYPFGFAVAFSKGFPNPWVCETATAETLELAICLFSKKLFSK